MNFTIRCVCGHRSDVPAGRAGVQIRCDCGRTIEVPLLSQLQRARAAGEVCDATECQEGFPADELAEARAVDEEMPREFFMILAPDHVIAQRVHQEAFVHFVAAFDRTVKSFARTTETASKGRCRPGHNREFAEVAAFRWARAAAAGRPAWAPPEPPSPSAARASLGRAHPTASSRATA